MLTKDESIGFLESLIGSDSVTMAAKSAIYWIKNPETTETAQRNVQRIKKLRGKLTTAIRNWNTVKCLINESMQRLSPSLDERARSEQFRFLETMTELSSLGLDTETPRRFNPPNPFWLVWNEQRTAPTHKHPTEEAARTEAERLAKANPGQQFHVLQLLGSCTFAGVDWSDQDEIPF